MNEDVTSEPGLLTRIGICGRCGLPVMIHDAA